MKLLIVGDPCGLHTQVCLQSGYKPEDIIVWESCVSHMVSIHEICDKIEVTNDLNTLTGMKFDIVIGNPPYGSGGNQAIKFLNMCGDLSDDIRMVLPVSVRKPSSQNKIRLDMVCIEDKTLPEDTFPRGIKTVMQRWVKSDTIRDKIKTFTTHPDFEFVKKSESPDCMIFRCGASTGKLRLPGEFDDNKADHYYIKAAPQVVLNLQSIQRELQDISLAQNGMPGISKHDLITTYIAKFGRSKIETFTTHPDFEFVDKSEADIMVGRVGGGPAGRVKLDNFDSYSDIHYFIKASPDVVQKFVAIAAELRELSHTGNNIPTLSKHDLISAYKQAYE